MTPQKINLINKPLIMMNFFLKENETAINERTFKSRQTNLARRAKDLQVIIEKS